MVQILEFVHILQCLRFQYQVMLSRGSVVLQSLMLVTSLNPVCFHPRSVFVDAYAFSMPVLCVSTY